MKRFLLFVILIFCGSAYAQSCSKLESVCVAPNETRNINGVQVFKECWQYEDRYQCPSKDQINDCQPLKDQGCEQMTSVCIERNDRGDCTTYENKYRCETEPGKTIEHQICDVSSYCDNGMCFDTSHPGDKDFGKSAVMLEAQRQAGVYGVDPGSIELFKGYKDECSIKVLGGATIKSCCKSSSGGAAFSNNKLLGAGLTVAGEGAKETARLGSKYVYDSLYDAVDSKIVNKGLDAMNSWADRIGDGSFNPEFSFYGFTFEFSFANGFTFTGFDPYSFAFQIGVMLIQEWLACDTSESVLSMKKGQDLCVHLRTYCSKKVLGVCVERSQEYCCFNSILAKLINRQGRAQLGMDMQSCGGFTADQLELMDFSQMDLSEFIEDMIPSDPNLGAMTEQVMGTVNEKVKNYYEK